MSQFGTEVDAIFAKPGAEWSDGEGAQVFKLMKEHGRTTVKQALEQVRSDAAKGELDVAG